MALFAISMIRNEIDVLPSFLSHLDNLFDSGCLVDHLSSDGSEILMRNFVASRENWEYCTLRTPAYAQAEISSELLKQGFRKGADAVFFLDADEFIAGMDRASLEEAVQMLDMQKSIGHLRWRNCLPGDYNTAFSLDKPVWQCDLSPHKKLVIPRWLYNAYGDSLGVNRGNHSLRLPDHKNFHNIFLAELLHFPVRSREQFVKKIIVSYVSQAMDPDKGVAPHIQMLFDEFVRRDFTPDMLNAIAVDYSTPLASGASLSRQELEKRGYAFMPPNVSRNGFDLLIPARSSKNVIDFGAVA